jgi:HAD superfamily hydrolase (TIGR01549 family)
MPITVLLDLDDTLLLSDMDKFLPAYLQALSNFLSDFPPEETIRQVMVATRHMALNRDPSKTLEEVFDASFYPGMGIDKKDIWNQIVDFYSNVFPSLKPLTQPKPGALDLVDYLSREGYRIIIATNPLFPQAATHHRLEWAGMPVEKYPFTIVSTYEHFHFSKPDPAYYTELLAQAGWPGDPVVMIGDDFDMDILPAARLGIPAFWITDHHTKYQMPENVQPGDISGVIPWLENISQTTSEIHITPPLGYLSVLRSTPAALDTFTKNFAGEDWGRRPGDHEWSITEVVCHLRDVDQEVNWPRLQKVMAEDNPFLPGVATDPWADERQYHQEDGLVALSEFIKIRQKLTELLSSLQPDDWHRKVRHAIFGPTEAKELIGFIATHDRVHIEQAKKLVTWMTHSS